MPLSLPHPLSPSRCRRSPRQRWRSRNRRRRCRTRATWAKRTARSTRESLHQAKDLLDRKQYAEAIAKLDALTAERPRESQARFMKGVALTDQGKADEAMTVFRAHPRRFPGIAGTAEQSCGPLCAEGRIRAGARRTRARDCRRRPITRLRTRTSATSMRGSPQSNTRRRSTLDKRNRTADAKLKQIREMPAQLGPFHPCAAHLYRAGRAATRTTT